MYDMSVAQVTNDTFQKEVLDTKGLVLVDFYAEWCGPCKMTSPILDVLVGEVTNVKFVKVNVDENSDLASKYNIFSIPTFLVFKDGKVISQFVGAMGKEGFLKEIEKAKGM